MSGHDPRKRFGTGGEAAFEPALRNMPPLPAIDWSLAGRPALELLDTPEDGLPEAVAVVLVWAEAEWAALQHVFCASGGSMPYDDRNASSWSGWRKYDRDLPEDAPEGWTYWGYYRLVKIEGHKVLLFKSNTHLDWPGESYLEDMIERMIGLVKPRLLLSTGTAGGARKQDSVGTIRAVRAGTLYVQGEPLDHWPDYANTWSAHWTVLDGPGFRRLLFPVPTTEGDLHSLCDQFNHHYQTRYLLGDLNADGLDLGDPSPRIHDMTGNGTSLLTSSTFVVATTSGSYQDFACIEMNDAVIAKVCQCRRTPFGFVRNISDPVQNQDLPAHVQGNWGGALYDAYGFYTSYNGALAAWAILAAPWESAE